MSSRYERLYRKTYFAWGSMKKRCYTKTCKDYKLYGARGIEVCERWRISFANFLADMGEKPEGLSLDRINNDGNYEPGNCRWATPVEQRRNSRRGIKWLTFRGRTQALEDWARELGIKSNTLFQRLDDGWSVERTLTEPLQPGRWH